MKPPVIIPVYKPGPGFGSLARAVISDGRTELIIVDDGSPEKYSAVFSALRLLPRVQILRHAVNLGKGQALKTAFNYFLNSFPPSTPGVVTADADGQHLPVDIAALRRALSDHPASLCLGVRKFRGVPARSAFGNAVTRWVFRVFSGRAVSDTQTGLRGIPRAFLPGLLRTGGGGYEFELEMLLLAVRSGMSIREVPINTVYIGKNETSHFNPVLDSLRIYFVFLRFSAAALLTALVDNFVFALCYLFSSSALPSIVAARLIASTLSFILNKNLVFRSRARVLPEILRFTFLVALFMSISYGLVSLLTARAGMNIYAAKLLAEGALFLASFAVQNILVFIRPETGAETPYPYSGPAARP